MKILIVEDHDVARTILRRALQKLGHEAVEAANGEEGWACLQSEPLRVVISDWMMPQADGLALCKRIRARLDTDYIYFILLTARGATDANRREASEAGVDDFLAKPLEQADLWTRLRTAERIIQWASRVRRLEALLPICSYCKRIRDDRNYWHQLEGYIHEHTGSEFTHSICPDCYTRVVLPQLLSAGITPEARPANAAASAAPPQASPTAAPIAPEKGPLLPATP